MAKRRRKGKKKKNKIQNEKTPIGSRKTKRRKQTENNKNEKTPEIKCCVCAACVVWCVVPYNT